MSSTLGFREHEAKGAPCLLKEAMEGCTSWKDLRLRKGINQLCQYQQHSDARTPSVDQAWSSPSERLNLNLYGAWLRTQPLSPLPLPLLQPSLLLSKKKITASLFLLHPKLAQGPPCCLEPLRWEEAWPQQLAQFGPPGLLLTEEFPGMQGFQSKSWKVQQSWPCQ